MRRQHFIFNAQGVPILHVWISEARPDGSIPFQVLNGAWNGVIDLFGTVIADWYPEDKFLNNSLKYTEDKISARIWTEPERYTWVEVL